MRSKEEIEKLLEWLQDAIETINEPTGLAQSMTIQIYAALGTGYSYMEILKWILKQPSPEVERLVACCQQVDAEIEAEMIAALKSVVKLSRGEV